MKNQFGPAKQGIAPVWMLFVFLIAVGLFIYVVYDTDRSSRDNQSDTPALESVDTTGWNSFTSETFSFSIRYPSDWRVSAYPDHETTPAFNVYPNYVEKQGLFTHHSDVPHVSIYPRGVPTEGLFGESVQSKIEFQETSAERRDFVLADQVVWATMAGFPFQDRPLSWSESGFVFARAPIQNLVTRCLSNGAVVSESECDPLFGDTIVREGTVDEDLRDTQVAILESFRFEQSAQTLGDLIEVTSPAVHDSIESPLIIQGRARGTWYFEATFPIVLADWDGRIIAEHFAEAQGEWMTEDWVFFKATLNFETPDISVSDRGTLILQKSNPSGLPQHDAALEVPVIFSNNST